MFITQHRSRVVDFTRHFLTVQATMLVRKPPRGVVSKISRARDLINQSEIKYGTIDTGIIIRAFRRTNETLYRMMWRNIHRFEPSAFTKTNEEGINRVRKEKYVFILPHTIGEYVSRRYPCDLMTVDRFLMHKGYGLAVTKGSPLLPQINRALTTLINNGYVDRLYKKWWYERNDCKGAQSSKIYSSHSGGKRSSGEVTARTMSAVMLVGCLLMRLSNL